MSNFSSTRREVLINIGKSIVLTGAGVAVLPPILAQHVHEHMAEEKSLAVAGYAPKFLTEGEFRSLGVLAEMIVPGAQSKGGAAEFIDFLCSRNADLAAIYTGGLAWMDDEMRRRHDVTFAAATSEQRIELLDLLAYRKNETPALAPGMRFFNWARNMSLDAYYTSPAGIAEVGFMGNQVLSKFEIPQEAIDYALKRSPFNA